jgi:hypothetical protein
MDRKVEFMGTVIHYDDTKMGAREAIEKYRADQKAAQKAAQDTRSTFVRGKRSNSIVVAQNGPRQDFPETKDLDSEMGKAAEKPNNSGDIGKAFKWLLGNTERDAVGGEGTRRSGGTGKDRLKDEEVATQIFETDHGTFVGGLGTKSGELRILDERSKADWEIGEEASGVSNGNWLQGNRPQGYMDPLQQKDINEIRKRQGKEPYTQGDFIRLAQEEAKRQQFLRDYPDPDNYY